MIPDRPIQYESWNGSYIRRLAPFIVLSVFLHIAAFGSVLGIGKLLIGGQGLSVLKFEAGESGLTSTRQPLLGSLFGLDRVKIFRIDFFREIIPWQPPEPEPTEEVTVEKAPVEIAPVEEPDEIEPLEEEQPIEEAAENPPEETPPLDEAENETPSVEIPITEAELLQPPATETEGPFGSSPNMEGFTFPENIPRMPSSGLNPMLVQPVLPEGIRDDEALPDAFRTFTEDQSATGQMPAFLLPSWELTDIDGNEWNDQMFHGNYTIYIIADMSRRHGLEEMLVWSYVIRQMTTNPQAAFPPYVAIVATCLENPYAYNELRVNATLKRTREQEHCMGVMIADRDGNFAKGLGYAELPQPVVLFADHNGYVRMLMIGRVRDISNNNIDAAMEIIAEMWQWNEEEFAALPVPISALINLLRDEAYDPSKREAEPLDISRRISPTWGYPFIPAEDETSPQ